jgi:type IV pilus assembly protein PilN
MRIIEELQQSRPLVVHLFDEIVNAIPEGTHLTAVEQTNQRVELTGVANSTTRVATLMRNIESSPWLDAPELGSIQATDNPGGRSSLFVVTARQKSDEAVEEVR